MNYRYGIVAYINGVEVYRDNMPEGAVTSSTAATGSYATIDYFSIIRPGVEVSTTNSIVAIEIHFTSGASQTTVDFNAFLAIVASSTPDANCFVYPYDKDIESTLTAANSVKVFDFFKTTSLSIAVANLPITFTFDFGKKIPYSTRFYSDCIVFVENVD